MTIQVHSFGDSKKSLQEALNTQPQDVVFYNPSIICSVRFTGLDISKGGCFPVVMDPQTRRRFATVMRSWSGEFRVK